ncbi:DUF3558 domain-containing protein [Pseudonocardia hierapolitana]|uniref:DUF3558 domain-containing protein n=1 Tax=Pseudonocardia hierapolitana TaxID=1128676 RepID=UPI003CCC5C0B
MVLVLLAGCTTIGGTPAPADPAQPTSAASTRPRDVRIDGIDPCSLLTDEQRAELGLDGRPVLDHGPSSLYPGGDVPVCVTRGFEPRAVSAGITLATTAGIDLYTAGSLEVDIQPTQVHGFPGVVAVPQRFTEWCSVIVDVAPGQLLDVQFADGGRTPPIPQTQLCEDAVVVADHAMSTLLAIR